MSQLGAPPTPPPYSPPPMPPATPPQSSDIPGWVVVTAAFLAFSIAGLLAFVVVNGRGTSPAAAPPHPLKHHYPQQWDKRVAPLAAYVSKQRGLEFEHPVKVRFLSTKAFHEAVRHDDPAMIAAQRRMTIASVKLLQGLGLATGDRAVIRTLVSYDDVSAPVYYSFQRKRIEVRGHRLTPALRYELVPELATALLDQRFHLGPRERTLLTTASGRRVLQGTALDALADGDASRLQGRYRASRPAAQRHAIALYARIQLHRAQRLAARVPALSVSMLGGPYALNDGLVRTVLAGRKGDSTLNKLLRRTPTDDTALLDPTRALAPNGAPAKVARPAVPHGGKRVAGGELGSVSLYVVLASRLPEGAALTAANGWDGDAYVVYQRHGATCSRLTVNGTTLGDAGRIDHALTQWAGDGGRYSVSRHGSRVTLAACSTAPAGAIAHGLGLTPLRLVVARQRFASGLLQHHMNVETAACASTRIVATFPYSELRDTYTAKNPWVISRIQQIVAECAATSGSSVT